MTLIKVTYDKEPWEQEPLRFDWGQRAAKILADGYVYSSHEVKVYNSADVEQPAMQAAVATRSGDYIYAWIAGDPAQVEGDYYLRVRVTCTKAGSPDYKIEGDLLIQVKEEGA